MGSLNGRCPLPKLARDRRDLVVSVKPSGRLVGDVRRCSLPVDERGLTVVIFLSYASADRDRVAPLAQALIDYGWDLWWDRKIPPGRTYDEVIEEAIDAASAVVCVWTERSVASSWVKNEADEGMRREVLMPISMDAVRIPLAFRRIQSADLTDWLPGTNHEGFNELVVALEELVGSEAVAVQGMGRNEPEEPAVLERAPEPGGSPSSKPGEKIEHSPAEDELDDASRDAIPDRTPTQHTDAGARAHRLEEFEKLEELFGRGKLSREELRAFKHKVALEGQEVRIQLERLSALREQGKLTKDEFDAAKQMVLRDAESQI
ncbi:MAG: toll/interleukin-1 receptor domain-containing protein [Actinomycetota bacterium]